MIFSSRESIEDSIIRLLSIKNQKSLDLYDSLIKEGNKVSYQAIYKALNHLLADSIIVKSGKDLSISREWVDKISDQLGRSFVLPPLSSGESVFYVYNSLVHLDAYWKHINKALEKKFPNFPVFIYNPYGIWLHLKERYESEVDYLRDFEKNKKYAFLVIGNSSSIDLNLKREYQNDYLQIDLWSNSSFIENDYFTIKGDYIITTKLSKEITPRITYIYKSMTNFDKVVLELKKVLNSESRSRLKLEYNPEKARVLRKKLFKNFFLPKDIIDTKDIF